MSKTFSLVICAILVAISLSTIFDRSYAQENCPASQIKFQSVSKKEFRVERASISFVCGRKLEPAQALHHRCRDGKVAEVVLTFMLGSIGSEKVVLYHYSVYRQGEFARFIAANDPIFLGLALNWQTAIPITQGSYFLAWPTFGAAVEESWQSECEKPAFAKSNRGNWLSEDKLEAALKSLEGSYGDVPLGIECRQPRGRGETIICADPYLIKLTLLTARSMFYATENATKQRLNRNRRDIWQVPNQCPTADCVYDALKKQVEINGGISANPFQ